jgi:hypothetical protein
MQDIIKIFSKIIMDYRDRIKIYMETMDVKPALFVLEVGFSNGLINKVISKAIHLGGEKLENMLNHFKDLNPTWLMTGVGTMLINPIQDKVPAKAEEPTPEYKINNSLLIETQNKLIKSQEEQIEFLRRELAQCQATNRKKHISEPAMAE